MTNVIDFAVAGDTLRQMRIEKAANAGAGEANLARIQADGQALKGPLDSSDDYEMYHVFETKDNNWEIWLPFNNAAVMTFFMEDTARVFARNMNELVGKGVGFYDGKEPTGPSYA